jgi:hypothetical protein
VSANWSGQSWAVGSVANGHVLTQSAGWVRLNARVNAAGPWRPGDVVNGHVFTGLNWVPLPTPTPPRQAAPPPMSPPAPPPMYSHAPSRTPRGFLHTLKKISAVLYCGFWVIVAAYSASAAQEHDEPRWLILTSTASLNILVFMVTGETRAELRKRLVPNLDLKAMLVAIFCGLVALAIAACGIWLSIQFDEPGILVWTLFVVLVWSAIAWVFH